MRWPLPDPPPTEPPGMRSGPDTWGHCAACGDTARLVRRQLCWMCLLTLTRALNAESLRAARLRLTGEEQARIDARVAEIR